MSHSSYYVTSSVPADVSSFGATLEDIRNRTTHLDTLFRHAYDTNEDLVALYTGFHAGSSKSFFRHYPGSESLTTDPSRTYDPVLRPWYSAAESASPNAAFTSPYFDAFGKKGLFFDDLVPFSHIEMTGMPTANAIPSPTTPPAYAAGAAPQAPSSLQVAAHERHTHL